MFEKKIANKKVVFLEVISYFSSYKIYLFFCLLLLTTKNVQLFLEMIFPFLLCFATTIVFRLFYFKDRPKKEAFNSIFGKIKSSSFPSMHAQIATLISLKLFIFFSKNKTTIFFITLFFLLSLYARVSLKKHDLTDIIAGVFIASTYFFLSNAIFFK
ncbi:MAG: phosphatase PAP2 family protein [Candidatus Woesearchaeota archaeon]|nr:phosphatase PAP2 family protein [Nanoarchaeota archaeon]USN44465.1 MAG: phosphatase PAP2 family protein [Candidatus Woesearchaeota archaeon]